MGDYYKNRTISRDMGKEYRLGVVRTSLRDQSPVWAPWLCLAQQTFAFPFTGELPSNQVGLLATQKPISWERNFGWNVRLLYSWGQQIGKKVDSYPTTNSEDSADQELF